MTAATLTTPLAEVTDARSMYEALARRLHNVVLDVELRIKAEIAVQINRLKKERNAVILGHNYMEATLFHSIPDFVGDSLYLSRMAAQTDKEVIVFCGVEFMAETAKILSPDKTVLLPAEKAGCSLAASITAEDVRRLKAQFPGVPVVTYVNTYADVKAETDVCCTSGNAVAVVNSLDSEQVIFLPDEYLAKNVAEETGKQIIFPQATGVEGERGGGEPAAVSFEAPGQTHRDLDTGHPVIPLQTEAFDLIGWHGRCEVHDKFTVDDIRRVRAEFPDVAVLSHPECSPEVVAASDFTGSTSAMIRHVEETDAPRYLLLTECSMGDNIIGANPDKEMLRLCSVRCPHMGQITMEDTLAALEKMQYEITVPEEILVRAARSVQRMVEIG
ncbi:MAG: quinolinate synthase NadA [Caldilineaceae bacterium SB0668_bin_21]|nr:quinolinate synthase NadA [Caldilineaceae bacterium SB0668_bin_21]MYC23242.1 quinolinate synthase NadA [Caldilineaceae bacterium SB0662_bin_25]